MGSNVRLGFLIFIFALTKSRPGSIIKIHTSTPSLQSGPSVYNFIFVSSKGVTAQLQISTQDDALNILCHTA
ncbi:hypothetical protein BD769DRAFT_187871 [Suillus cothurnatus]|nr:hypothetical protein BD769DRAFT_187871 [Suillus cothurnatus]